MENLKWENIATEILITAKIKISLKLVNSKMFCN